MIRLLSSLFLASALLGAAPAWAQDGDEIDLDALDSAAALQADAIAAALEENWVEAKRLATRALELEASITTAQARLVLARAHEALGDYDAALRQVDNYLALPLLDRDRSRGEEVKERVEARIGRRDAEAGADRERASADRERERAEAERRRADQERARAEQERLAARAATPQAVRQQRAGGIGLMAGGAAPTIVGIWFVATDAHWAGQGVESGTWAAIGAPVLVTGVVLEAVGAALLATAPNAGKRRVQVSGTVAPTQGGMSFGLTGRF